MKTKTVQVIKNNSTGILYAVVAGTILPSSEALEREMYFGWVDIAPTSDTSLVETITWLYERPNNFTLTEETFEYTLPERKPIEDIPTEKLEQAQEKALDLAVSIGITTLDITPLTGEEKRT